MLISSPKTFFPLFFFKKLVPFITDAALQALNKLLRRLDEILESKITSLLHVLIFLVFSFYCIYRNFFANFFEIT